MKTPEQRFKKPICPICGTELELSWYQPKSWLRLFFCPKGREEHGLFDADGKRYKEETKK